MTNERLEEIPNDCCEWRGTLDDAAWAFLVSICEQLKAEGPERTTRAAGGLLSQLKSMRRIPAAYWSELSPAGGAPMKTRSSETLADFVRYCESNPQMRFWQALRNWSGFRAIVAVNGDNGLWINPWRLPSGFHDTFPLKGKS